MPPLNELLTRTKPELGLEYAIGDSSNKYGKQDKVVDEDKLLELVQIRLLEDAEQERRCQMALVQYRVQLEAKREEESVQAKSKLDQKSEEYKKREAEVEFMLAEAWKEKEKESELRIAETEKQSELELSEMRLQAEIEIEAELRQYRADIEEELRQYKLKLEKGSQQPKQQESTLQQKVETPRSTYDCDYDSDDSFSEPENMPTTKIDTPHAVQEDTTTDHNIQMNYCQQRNYHNVRCYYCNRSGHKKMNCKKLYYDRLQRNVQQNRQYNRRIYRTAYITSFSEASNRKDTFTSMVNNRFARSIRDTRCSTIAVRSSFVRRHQYTGRTQHVHSSRGITYVWPTAIIQISTTAATRTVEAAVFRYGPHDLILGNIKGVKQFQIENDMNLSTQARSEQANTRIFIEPEDRTMCDLHKRSNNLVLDMNTVLEELSKKITEIGSVVLSLRKQNDQLNDRLVRLEKKVNNENEEYVLNNSIGETAYYYCWSALNQIRFEVQETTEPKEMTCTQVHGIQRNCPTLTPT